MKPGIVVQYGIKLTHAGSFLVMRDEFYLCDLTYSTLEMHKCSMKTCDHVSSRDKKKRAGSYFVVQAGLRNNEFCLCGLIYRLVDQKYFLSYFSDRLTFSNLRGRTSRRIYRLTLPLFSPEMLSWLSK